ncbi:hypothetical protein [uncultured Pseudomonas sp.]|uniref:hypothetical protein n=1 Tax=Pseudomonas sp. 22072 TaxID=3453865 RepID=UPI0028D0A9AF|nr:hypothetical protein [uncultured Pseudomonas sp.]
MYSNNKLAIDLEKTLARGFDITKIAEAAFKIHQDHCLELTTPMRRALLVLMAMEEGPEFELTEAEFTDLITEIKAM